MTSPSPAQASARWMVANGAADAFAEQLTASEPLVATKYVVPAARADGGVSVTRPPTSMSAVATARDERNPHRGPPVCGDPWLPGPRSIDDPSVRVRTRERYRTESTRTNSSMRSSTTVKIIMARRRSSRSPGRGARTKWLSRAARSQRLMGKPRKPTRTGQPGPTGAVRWSTAPSSRSHTGCSPVATGRATGCRPSATGGDAGDLTRDAALRARAARRARGDRPPPGERHLRRPAGVVEHDRRAPGAARAVLVHPRRAGG